LGKLLIATTLATAAALFASIAAAGVSVAGATLVADTNVPTCDQFLGRLETADRTLELRQMNPIRLSREPQESNGDDLWTVHDDNGDEIMDVSCRNGTFLSLEMIFPNPNLGSPHPQFDYIAAGIFGFTGWPADKVIKTAIDVWNTKRRMTPEWEVKGKNYQNVNLPGLCATISYSEFTVGDCAD
jgi:hypothetical protein